MTTDFIKIDWLRQRLIDLQFEQILSEEQMKAIFKIIAEYDGKMFEPKKYDRAKHDYKGLRCWHCKYLNGEQSSVGIECTNPNKAWKHRTSKYKAPSTYACKNGFERRKDADI